MTPLRRDAAGPARLRLAIALAVVVPLGFALKFAYRGPGATWAANHAAGVLYEVFWVAAVCLVFPRLSPWRVAAGVLAATCFLEFLQLCRARWLVSIRSTLLGGMLLGDSFDWWDFPHYVAGCTIGWAAAAWCRRAGRHGPVDTHARAK